jgi:GH25 family lysozyme M1 (1,4-beta-N-acetylmuramidase)
VSDAEADLLGSLTETGLYSIGAFFADRHPDLCEDVIAEAQAIEDVGLSRWATEQDTSLDHAFQTLVTGLAVRYYKAVAGTSE